jgi:ApbE superfamily uncharacterized protein (UPF0280 family)
MTGATVQILTGERLHLAHGPIDVILRVWAAPDVRARAHAAAVSRFATILPELCAEIGRLRAPVGSGPAPESPVGRRMHAACVPFADRFVTPMAAVAGAVADELMATMLAAGPVRRAYVNDGGDIALHVAPGETLDIGLAGDPAGIDADLVGSTRIGAGDGISGVATSGAGGRSFSLGIAEAVTVLARDAAAADVAATMVANAVDVDHPAVIRRPARSLDPDSDLGDRPVTVSVGALDDASRDLALDAGLARALEYRRRGLVAGAALTLGGRTVATGRLPAAIGERKAS